MCGRVEYVVTKKEILEDYYGVKLVEGYTDQGFGFPRYNVPPTAHMPILTLENEEEILIGHWGYLPSWSNPEKKAKEVINARAETVLEKPYFKSAALKRRCLIPITGFFEWKREEKAKVPFRFHMGGELFSLGGVYTDAKDKKGRNLPHYAIITTEANKLMSPVHERIPVIIPREREEEWLQDSLEEKEIFSFFKPFEVEGLVKDKISTLVNSPRNDKPEILRPI